MRARQLSARLLLVLLTGVALTVLAACGDDGGGSGGGGDGAGSDPSAGDDDGASAADVPSDCEEAPLTMTLEAFGDQPAGSDAFEVTDAVVRRVPILTGVEGTAADADELAEMEARAAETPVALYALYLGDFEIDRSALEGFGFGEVTPPAGGTIGTISIVSPTEDGLSVGDVVDGDTTIEYSTTTTFGTLGLIVLSDTRTAQDGFSSIDGGVEVKALDDDVMCLDLDVTFVDSQGEPVSRVAGTVVAPIVRSAPSFFFN